MDVELNEKKSPIPWAEAHKPDAVERLFISAFNELPKHEMSEEEFKRHTQMLAIETMDNPEKEQQVHTDSMKEIFLYRITEKRSKAMLLELSPCLMFVLAMISTNPATIVMYLPIIRHWATKNNTNSVNLHLWLSQIMPFGYPSEDDLKTLWYSVKVNNDLIMGESNLLDIGSAYKSIMPAETDDKQTPPGPEQ